MTRARRPLRRLDRRDFLRGLGIGAAGLSLLPSVVTRAAEPTFPKRLVAIFTPNGSIPEAWVTKGAGEKDFTLGPILKPLAPYRDKLLLLSGLDNKASYDGPGAAHQKGTGAFLTGRPLNDGNFTGGGDTQSGWASGISLDQELGKALGSDTPHATLELGVQVEGSNNRHRIAYAGSDKPLPPDDDPKSVFQRLFGNLSTDPVELAAIERRLRRRQSVLDFVESDLQKLQTKLGKDEWERLEAHVESIRDVEKRLEMPTQTCEAPTLPTLDHKKAENYPAVSKLQLDMLAAAFACDLTRFATVLFGGGTSGKRFPWLGFEDRHHELSHAGTSDTVARGKLVKINAWYAEQVAHLLAKLDSIPEGTGTVLDNTVVLWGGELSVGNNHSRKGMNWVLAGSAGGTFRTGRLVSYSGASHNDLLVSLANAMGHPIQSFGLAKHCSGPLPKLT